MSKYDKKFLISGCGMSWGGQERKTWINIWRLAGADIIDCCGPAVSNQYIVNEAVKQIIVHQESVTDLILQLTALGKLDVEITPERKQVLVDPDTKRNFLHNSFWPSSMSREHESKQSYYRWLWSPSLEIQDLYTKLILLSSFCREHNIRLHIHQGYAIPWPTDSYVDLINICPFLPYNWNDEYTASPYYADHDHSNSVPCLAFQFKLAERLAKHHHPELVDFIVKMLAKSKL